MNSIILSNRKVLFDPEDWDKIKIFIWRLQQIEGKKFKVVSGARKTQIYMHQVILGCPKGFVIDHINGNPLDNRKSNLRVCTQQENSFNRPRSKNNTSGYKGVSKRKETGKFRAYIHHNFKYRYLGDFKTSKEAAEAYDSAAVKLFGQFAQLNFSGGVE
jgi:hypothetical protein